MFGGQLALKLRTSPPAPGPFRLNQGNIKLEPAAIIEWPELAAAIAQRRSSDPDIRDKSKVLPKLVARVMQVGNRCLHTRYGVEP